jgi:hypothetical protein
VSLNSDGTFLNKYLFKWISQYGRVYGEWGREKSDLGNNIVF